MDGVKVICENAQTCEARGYCTHAREHEEMEDETGDRCDIEGHLCEFGGWISCAESWEK